MFTVFTHVNVGTLLAIGFPDTRDYYRRDYYPAFTVHIYTYTYIHTYIHMYIFRHTYIYSYIYVYV